MYQKSPATVLLAISNCLGYCLTSEAQLTALHDFTEELKGQGWSPETIKEVERGVLVALSDGRAGKHFDDRQSDSER